MAYSNSPLATYTKLSPNNSGNKTKPISRFTPHCIVGQWTVETAGNYFAKSSVKASCNYAIGKDGRIGLIVPESKIAWTSSSKANDSIAVTVECASDAFHPYRFEEVCYQSLINLCVDVCKRNGKNKLVWLKTKEKTLAYTPKSNEMLLTLHRWYKQKACVPTDSEVLTKNGWVKLSDINVGDEIACADLDNLRITFEEVYDKVEERSQDTYTNSGFTATKDHRCIYTTQSKKPYRIEEYKTLLKESKSNQLYIPIAGYSYFGGFDITDEELRFLVAVQADGHYMNDVWGGKKNNYGLEFHFKKERKIERIKQLLESLHYEYTVSNKSDGSTSIRIYGKYVVESCEKYLQNKCFTWDWINLSRHQAEVFFEEILLWDGCKVANLYSSKEKINLDVVNAIAVLNGIGSRVSGSNVSFRETPFVTLGNREQDTVRNIKTVKSTKNKTTVSCVSVKTGIFIVRQNGRPYITGNCPGDWLVSRLDSFTTEVNKQLQPTPKPVDDTPTAEEFYKMFKIAMNDYLKNLASKPESDWSKDEGYWKKASSKNGVNGKPILDGSNPLGNITREQMSAILGRLGLLE